MVKTLTHPWKSHPHPRRIDMLGRVVGVGRVVARAENAEQGSAQWLWRCSQCKAERAIRGTQLRRAPAVTCIACGAQPARRRA